MQLMQSILASPHHWLPKSVCALLQHKDWCTSLCLLTQVINCAIPEPSGDVGRCSKGLLQGKEAIPDHLHVQQQQQKHDKMLAPHAHTYGIAWG